MASFAERLQQALQIKGMSAAQLSRKLNIDEGTISNYKKGKYEPKQRRTQAIANALNISIDWLMGADVPMSQNMNTNFNYSNVANISPLPQTNKKPRLGVIACGEPITAEENIDDYDEVPEDIKCDFTLLCKGDSMINARINDGDIVYIRQQDEVNNGEIAACLVDGEFETEATLKRYFRYDDKIVLQAENPMYPPFVYVNEEMNKVHIIGKAVGFTSML